MALACPRKPSCAALPAARQDVELGAHNQARLKKGLVSLVKKSPVELGAHKRPPPHRPRREPVPPSSAHDPHSLRPAAVIGAARGSRRPAAIHALLGPYAVQVESAAPESESESASPHHAAHGADGLCRATGW